MLDEDSMKVVVTHREELQQELDETLHMERYFRRFGSVGMLAKEKEYVQNQLHSRKTRPAFNVREFYLAVNEANEDQPDDLRITSLSRPTHSTHSALPTL